MNLDSSAFLADPELMSAIEKKATRVRCTEDGILFRQGETPTGLYLLRSGEARLSMTSPTGELVMSAPMAPGALLGLPGVVGNTAYTLTAHVSKGAELSFITKQDFSDLMLSDPALGLKVLRVLAAEVRSARNAISES